MNENRRSVFVELDENEIKQIEEVLLRHRRTPAIMRLQEKLGVAKNSILVRKDKD